MPLRLEGTVFSGHSTKTTLGNTLRSLMYAYYYAIEAGIERPWDSRDLYVIAAGDDVCLFVRPIFLNRLLESILRLSSRTKTVWANESEKIIGCVGLG